LAHEHGIHEIEKISKMGIKVDFCQGLDARLIDDSIAKLLSKVSWDPTIRLACDSHAMIEPVRKAVELLRWHNARPTRYMVYVLIKDTQEALERIRFLKGMDLDPHAQPYRDLDGTEPTQEQKDLARWCDMKAVYKKCTWEEYKARNISETIRKPSGTDISKEKSEAASQEGVGTRGFEPRTPYGEYRVSKG
jgi:hypothetical protein